MRIYAIALAALGLVTMIGLAYWHYDGLVEEINTLSADKASLVAALEVERTATTSLQLAIKEWKEGYDRLARAQIDLSRAHQAATAETRRLNELLGRHDLGALARSKPGLVERRVNDGTARAMRLLECASTPGGCTPDRGGAPADVRGTPATGSHPDPPR